MMQRKLQWLVLLSAVPLTFGFAQFKPGLTPVSKELKDGFNSIKPDDGRKILAYLAGPECEGRGTGEPGYQKATEYVAMQFKKAGLKSVMPDGSFFQFNDFWRVGVDTKSLAISSDTYKVPTKEIGVSITGNVDVSGEVVVVYLSGKVAALGDDMKSQIEGKVVFLRNDSTTRGIERSITALGPKAVVSITSNLPVPGFQGRASDPGTANARAGRLALRPEEAVKLIPNGTDLITNPGKDSVKVSTSGVSVTLRCTQIVEKIKVANVVAKLEGNDPLLKEEYVGVGAHLDHLGRRGDVIYYGADDDGSGCTGLIQLAHALSKNPIKPKRSVLFMAFYGEEMGLLGSRFLSDNSPVPLDKMIAELQMDMVGRDSDGAQNGDPNRMDKASENTDTIRLVGSKRISTRLDDIIQEMNGSIGFRFKYDAEDVYTRSDHYNFARKGIPIAFFFSGFHADYHQPTDTIEKINYDKIANTAKLAYLTIHKLGQEAGPLPKIQKSGGN